jgi:hypothetical protein
MRELVPLITCLCLSFAAEATAAPPRFDHFGGGKEKKHGTVKCNDCHRISASAAWKQDEFPGKDHKPCESSGCHAGKLVNFDPRKPDFCLTCHERGPGGRGIDIHRRVYPPYRAGSAAQLHSLVSSDHAKHVEAQKCEACHDRAKVPGKVEMTVRGHDACGACHGSKSKPAMDDCSGCHVKAEASPGLASAQWTDYRVEHQFTHAAHEKASKKNDCLSCHQNTKVKKGDRVPLPAMKDCTGCHDGEQAFDALGSQCRRCHEAAQLAEKAVAPVAPMEFSHAKHADQKVIGTVYACRDCHPSTEKGKLAFPGGGKGYDPKGTRNGHWPCEKCHQEQLMSQSAKAFCRNCHEHSDPWRANPTLAKFGEATDWSSDLPHPKHAEVECKNCHFEEAGQKAPPVAATLLAPSHEECARCHETIPAQPMTKCEGCHRPFTPADAPSEWSVAAKFPHDRHQVDARSKQPMPCAECHGSAIDTKPFPEMKQCRACHDGSLAFKDTGFECYRCHGPLEAKL